MCCRQNEFLSVLHDMRVHGVPISPHACNMVFSWLNRQRAGPPALFL